MLLSDADQGLLKPEESLTEMPADLLPSLGSSDDTVLIQGKTCGGQNPAKRRAKKVS